MIHIDSETLQRIRRIEIKTRRIVRDNLAGAYHSMFKGRGMAFETVRPYAPGDDVRDIDWNVTARSGGLPFVKQYAEERELTVLLVVDASASCAFGTTSQRKQERAVEIAAVLALAAVQNNDKVGLLIFSDQIEHFTPPRKGRNHILRLIRDLLTLRPAQSGTDLGLALKSVNNYLKQRAVVFVISDFLAAREEYATALQLTSRKHDVVAVVLSDPREQTWDDAGLVALRDAETGQVAWVDTHAKSWRDGFAGRAARFQQMRATTLARAGVARIDLPAEGDYVAALAAFFQRRKSS